jgi:hypothetical protein
VTKAPKGYNTHLLTFSPFPRLINEKANVDMLRTRIDSEAYDKIWKAKIKSDYVTDVPLPTCLMRIVSGEFKPSLLSGSPKKITGFRIQVKGRRGLRSQKSVMTFGKMGIKDIDRTFVDFGKTAFVGRRGSNGVRVWVGYQ